MASMMSLRSGMGVRAPAATRAVKTMVYKPALRSLSGQVSGHLVGDSATYRRLL